MVKLIPDWDVLGIYSHDYLDHLNPLDPVAVMQLLLKYIRQFRKDNGSQFPVYWISQHPMPSIPFIEACEVLGETVLPKSIKFLHYEDEQGLDSEREFKVDQRNYCEALFAKIQVLSEEQPKVLIILYDLSSLLYPFYSTNRDERIRPFMFEATLFRLLDQYKFHLIYTNTAAPSPFVDEDGDRRTYPAWITTMKSFSHAFSILHHHHWLVRPPSKAKLMSELRDGLNTVVSLTYNPLLLDIGDRNIIPVQEAVQIDLGLKPEIEIVDIGRKLEFHDRLLMKKAWKDDLVLAKFPELVITNLVDWEDVNKYQIPEKSDAPADYLPIPSKSAIEHQEQEAKHIQVKESKDEGENKKVDVDENNKPDTNKTKELLQYTGKDAEHKKSINLMIYVSKLPEFQNYFESTDLSLTYQAGISDNKSIESLSLQVLVRFLRSLNIKPDKLILYPSTRDLPLWIIPFLALVTHYDRMVEHKLYPESDLRYDRLYDKAINHGQIQTWKEKLAKHQRVSSYYRIFDGKKLKTLAALIGKYPNLQHEDLDLGE
ncbi:MAG: hypothetical protein IH840_14110, partial [Candidatus Heimdallarchaeota archaeon]|nr:hypothetical protein [Candidatus Heimdallarchaeota archaeon]